MTCDAVEPSTRSGDYSGIVSIDRHESGGDFYSPQYVSLPDGYIPMGFSLFQLHPDRDGKIPYYVYAVREETAGSDGATWMEHVEANGHLPVECFPARIDPRHFAAIFKSVDIRVVERSFELPIDRIRVDCQHAG